MGGRIRMPLPVIWLTLMTSVIADAQSDVFQIAECSHDDNSTCQDYSTCEFRDSEFRCFCNDAFFFDDTDGTCKVNNTCTDTSVCSHACSNETGVVTCHCPRGFQIETETYRRCEVCPADTFFNGSTCQPCMSGRKTPFIGATDSDECIEPCGLNQGFRLNSFQCEDCQAHNLVSASDELFCHAEVPSDMMVDVTMDIHVTTTNCDFHDEVLNLFFVVVPLLSYTDDQYIFDGICAKDFCGNIRIEVKRDADGDLVCDLSPQCMTDDCEEHVMTLTIQIYGAREEVQVLKTDTKRRHVTDAISEALYLSEKHSSIPTRRMLQSYKSRFLVSSSNFTVTQLTPEDIDDRRVYLSLGLDVPFEASLMNMSSPEFANLTARLNEGALETFFYMIPNFQFLQLEYVSTEPYYNNDGDVYVRLNATVVLKTIKTDQIIDSIVLALVISWKPLGGTFGTSGISFMGEMRIFRNNQDISDRNSAVSWCGIFKNFSLSICPTGFECKDSDISYFCFPSSGCDKGTYFNGTNCKACPANYTTLSRQSFSKDHCIDIDECNDPSNNNCNIETQDCNNQDGGYSCSCKSGFEPDPDSVTECYSAIEVNFTLTLAMDVSGLNLSDVGSVEYNTTYHQVLNALSDRLKNSSQGFKKVIINNLRAGSLIVDGTVSSDRSINENAEASVLDTFLTVAQSGLPINGSHVVASFQLANNVEINAQSTKCDVLRATSPCGPGTSCEVDSNGDAQCKADDDSDDDDEVTIIIVVVVCCSVTFLITILIIGICCLKRKEEN